MNAIFTIVCISSFIALLFLDPENLLSTLIGGAKNALYMTVTLFCIYAAWMGLAALAEESGITKACAKGINPITKKLFKTENEKACELIAMNLTCNLLGVGASTPFAVSAIRELEKDKNTLAQKLLFIINATSVQILPTTVIALRASEGSVSATDIFLPSLICTVVSTVLAVVLFLAGRKWLT